MQKTNPWEIPRPETVWNAVAEFEHDYREEIGMKDKVHSYHCRRCRLELLLRHVMKQFGDPPD
jgi:hypothetical protein